MSKPIIEGLNPQQAEAISYIGSPLLVLAGAGSGKTKVITQRFAHLSKKSGQNSILTVTFTNKAANEMKERISAIIKKDLKHSWIGTFHSQCMRILRKEIKPLGYGCDFSIYDESDQSNLIRHILKEFKIFEAMYKGILSRISNLKSLYITPEEFISKGGGFGFEERLARIYVRYQDELKRSNALDFDDLLMLTVKLFEQHPQILDRYRERFEHILVDEFQDTNPIQYSLIKQLAHGDRSICVVGDDDQSIYAFRGANINNILDFDRDFPNAKIIKLEQNYRSTQKIIDASSNLIASNRNRRAKKIWSDKKDGENVTRCWFTNENEEAVYIAKLIKEFYLKGMFEFSDVSVLYRINVQSKAVEDALRREKVPYRVLGGLSFYHRKEIKDLTAYMKLILNKSDNVSLRRIINCPPRGIGASTLSKIEQAAKKGGLSLYAAIKGVLKSSTLSATAKEKLTAFAGLIDSLSSREYKDAGDMLKHINSKSGLSELNQEDKALHVKELIDSAEGKPVDAFADMLSLASPTEDETKDNAVSLLTMHSAKGLEFPLVFVSGLEEGLLPYFKAKTPHEIEEERRLLYVGMTRAKDILILTGAKRRRLYSKVQEQSPSRFIESIPEACCKRIEKIVETAQPVLSKGKKLKTFKTVFAYSIGSRVRHPKWGVGVVRDCYGDEADQKITVNFPNFGIKRLALKFANLERI